MSLKNNKTLNACLIALNDHIVAMKNVVKKAKVKEIQSLIRKIKLLDKKKGTDAQIQKNKRKCDHLNNEIKEIKKLKHNDVAFFAIENEAENLEDYIKKNKNLNSENISLARLAFNKIIKSSICKLKNDPKLGGWKKTFIQFKSRNEKRKSWKEKAKLFKEIEANLKLNKSDESGEENNDDSCSPKKDTEVKEESKIDESLPLEKEKKESIVTKKTKKKTKKSDTESSEPISNEKKKKKKTPLRQVKFSDDSSDSDELQTREIKFSDEESDSNIQGEFRTREVKFSDDESDSDIQSEFKTKEVKFSDDDEDAESSLREEDNEFFLESFSNDEESEESKKNSNKPELKPLVFEKRPAQMEIKQINLNEIKDFNEIPISNKEISSDDEEEKSLKNEQLNSESQTNKLNSFKLKEDPFFLDQNGREVINHTFDQILNQNDYSRRRIEDDFYTSESYSSYDRYGKNSFRNKRDSLNSSFKPSLSGDSRSFDKNNYQSRKQPYTRFEGNERKSTFNKRSNDDFSSKNIRDKSNFKNSFSNQFSKVSFNERPAKVSNEAKSIDTSHLHPSWQAKKQQEEKLKSMKFEGKKVKFDDD